MSATLVLSSTKVLLNAVQLLPEHLTRSLCNGSEGDDGMPQEMKTELSGIYRLIIHCFICITAHLSGKPYAIQPIWGRLVLLLERWGKYNKAEEEGFALLESLRNLLVDLAKYVDALLDFISKFAKGFYSSGKVACKDGSELSLEVADNMRQPSEALEVCCKTILKHIELLCQPQLTYSKSFQDSMTSIDSIKGVIKDAFTQCVRIIDVLHKLDTSNSRAVVIQSILSVAKISFSNSSLFFSLVQQWIKMLCEDFSDVNGMDAAPSLYKRLLFRCSKLPKNIMGEILEQKFLAYDQLGA